MSTRWNFRNYFSRRTVGHIHPFLCFGFFPCRLLAEKWFSGENIYPNTVYVDIGRVIGASIFFNGELLRNNVGAIGEIGHFCVSPGEELCTCGNQGCLMTVASTNVIIRQIKQALKQGTISTLANPDYSDLTIQMVLNAAEANDRLAIHFLSNAAQYIGKAISFIVNLIGPELIILGGDMITDSNFFFDSIVAEIKRFSLYLMIDNLFVRKATLNYYGGALGAVCIVMDEAFSDCIFEP
ncbi:MAG: ROK family protein [Oscillospiraceae bacterium]|nr:ROK family protein [Oscillospiraceae bacterium]